MRKSIYLFIIILFSVTSIYSQQVQNSSNVNQQVINTFTGNSAFEKIPFIAKQCKDGSMYVAGSIAYSYFNKDYLLLKYDANGNLLWSKTYDGPAHKIDTVRAMHIDENGCIYLTGYSQGIGNNWSAITQKYNKDGDLIWSVGENNNSSEFSFGFDVTTDKNLNVYVAGWCYENDSYDCMFLKYSSDGELLKKVKANGSHDFPDEAYKIAFSPGEDFIYLSCALDEVNGGRNFAVIKYDINCNFIWKTSYDGTAHSHDYATDIKVGKNGDIYVCGTSEGMDSETDLLTMKLNPNGDILWVQRYDGLGHGLEWVNSLKLDALDNLYMCGGTQGLTLDTSISLTERNNGYVIKYNSDGVFQWESIYDGPNHFHDCIQDFDFDNEGNIYMIGRTSKMGALLRFSDDLYAIKIDKNGNRKWLMIYDSKYHNADYGSAIIYNKISNTVFGIGRSLESYPLTKNYNITYNNIILLKYTINEIETYSGKDKGKTVLSNFPNPFNPVTQIQFTIATDDFVKLNVYDLSGRLIKNLIEGNQTAGNHQVTFDGNALSSGVYFYTLQTSSERITNKFILNK